MTEDALDTRAGRMHLPRSRGAVSGVALIVLGLWGALAPFIGPYFDFAFTPDPTSAWHWTAARGWYEVLPGGVAVLGGLLLLFSANRALTSLGAWIGVVAGGWFVVGPQVSRLITLGDPGSPASSGLRLATAEGLAFFTALGAVIVLFAALAAGRLSVHSVRDAQAAQRLEAARLRERERQREAAAADGSAPPVATTEHPDAPYAPDGHTPAPSEPPADATATPGGPGYATPQRYVRGSDPETGSYSVDTAEVGPPAPPSEQIPVEQLRRDHEQR